MAAVTKDTKIGEILVMDGQARGAALVLMKNGMHCIGCPSSSGESLEQACYVHGMPYDKVLNELNDYFASKEA